MSKARYLVLLPLIVILAVVEIYPLAESFYFSITNYNEGGAFVGGANYAKMFSDPRVYSAIGVSLTYAIGSTFLCIGIGLVLTFLVTKLKRSRGFFESFFLMPLAVAPISVGVVWDPAGFWDDINTFWHYVLGLPYFNLTNLFLAFPIMILSEAWEWAPIIMLVAISVISGVPKEVFEAASLHGATSLQIFRKISIPTILRSRVMQFMIVLRFIDSMRAFEIPFTWTTWISLPNAGSPVDTVSVLLFKLLFVPTYGFPISYVSGVAIILLIITFSATTVLYTLMKRMGKT
jgi:multiple sugar transport system permease protein